MSADKDHAHDPSKPKVGHESVPVASDAVPPPTDIIPESSPQDLILKFVTLIGAVLIVGTFGWWWTQPLSPVVEGHGGGESSEH